MRFEPGYIPKNEYCPEIEKPIRKHLQEAME